MSKTNRRNNGNGHRPLQLMLFEIRKPSLTPQYPGDYILPLSIQEDFAARAKRLKAEGKMPRFEELLNVVSQAYANGAIESD